MGIEAILKPFEAADREILSHYSNFVRKEEDKGRNKYQISRNCIIASYAAIAAGGMILNGSPEHFGQTPSEESFLDKVERWTIAGGMVSISVLDIAYTCLGYLNSKNTDQKSREILGIAHMAQSALRLPVFVSAAYFGASAAFSAVANGVDFSNPEQTGGAILFGFLGGLASSMYVKAAGSDSYQILKSPIEPISRN